MPGTLTLSHQARPTLKRVVEEGSQAIRDYRPAELSQWLHHVELGHDGVKFDAVWARHQLEQVAETSRS